jgi:hypothetical protein
MQPLQCIRKLNEIKNGAWVELACSNTAGFRKLPRFPSEHGMLAILVVMDV